MSLRPNTLVPVNNETGNESNYYPTGEVDNCCWGHISCGTYHDGEVYEVDPLVVGKGLLCKPDKERGEGPN